ncbi:hypothetical protein STAS_20580 [Striga asiatica]|uniref:Trichome birefringence-like C-terminal domain-containing protein n=1 Tax=Striga asiatica TaxID=4170 RepID=A0A5A7QFC6_STRAF|nr:hypothetical protein STAS_20580 [Striga asiatica]
MSYDMIRILESTIKDLEQRGVKVEYINITQMSSYRGDAHPATNRMFWGVDIERRLKNDPMHFADCLLWSIKISHGEPERRGAVDLLAAAVDSHRRVEEQQRMSIRTENPLSRGAVGAGDRELKRRGGLEVPTAEVDRK